MQNKKNNKLQKSSIAKTFAQSSLPASAKQSASQIAAQTQLAKGYALHQQGNLAQAQMAYLEALKLNPKNFEGLQLLGTLCAQARQSADALVYFDKALEVNANSASVLNNRGIVLMELKSPALALESYDKAILLQHDYPEAHSNKGNALQALNQLRPAVASYEWAIALRPGFADTYINKGVVLQRLGECAQAITSFTKALHINPSYSQAYYNAGRSFRQLGHLETALKYYNQAIHFNPSYTDAYNNRGNILLELKDYSGALESFNTAIGLNSNAPQLHNNKGNVYKELKHFDEAIASYKTAIQIYPQYADAHNNLGNVFQELKRFNDALICYDLALSHNPKFVDALSNKGVVLRELKQSHAAIDCYAQALLLNPQFAQGYFNLGNALKELDQPVLARMNYQRALAIDSKYQSAKWGNALLNIPTFIHSVEHLEQSRLAFSDALIALATECTNPDFLNAYQSVGLHQPFYLAYQERNNKELIESYAQICHTVMSHWEVVNQINARSETSLKAVANLESKKIRLGIISDQIRYHSVWNAITKGLVEHLSSENFEIHIFYLGTLNDDQTAFAKSRATTFTQNLPSLRDWAQAVLAQNLDALLYPEIGMHALTLQLAHLRLAPLQMVSWGHPETTGIKSMDYYLSSELFEDAYSEGAYSEKLLTLPSLGCTYGELKIEGINAETELLTYGVRSDSTLILCPGTLFKYSPEYDWTFAAIAKKLLARNTVQPVPIQSYQFLFLYRDQASCALFKARLQKAFEKEGLKIDDWVVFLPWMNPQSFYGLMGLAHVFMDTLGFSGFNTAMQAIECALPVVTKRGGFLRGRFASGILTALKLQECIAHSDEEYVDKVVELASNASLRASISEQIQTRRHILFNDLEPVRAFEEFLVAHCKSKG